MIRPIPASLACAAFSQHPEMTSFDLYRYCIGELERPDVPSPVGSRPWFGMQVERPLLEAAAAELDASLLHLSAMSAATLPGGASVAEDSPGRGVLLSSSIFSAHPDALLLPARATLWHVADAKMTDQWQQWVEWADGERRETVPARVLLQLLIQHRLFQQAGVPLSPVALVPLLLQGRFELRRIDLTPHWPLLQQLETWHYDHVVMDEPPPAPSGAQTYVTAVKGTYLDTAEAIQAAEAYLEARQRAAAFEELSQNARCSLLSLMGPASAIRDGSKTIITRDARNVLRAGGKQ